MAAFIKHIPCETCGSSDARGLYSDDGEYCFSCKSVKPGSEYKDEDSYERPPIRTSARKETMTVEIKSTKPVIDPDDAAEIKEYSTLQGFNFRNIKDETYRQFGVRHAVDENNAVIEQYYPCTQEGQLVGYKIREVPKTFYSKGRTGADCELFMQFRFNRGGKYVMITEGEVDSLSGYQMLKDYYDKKDSGFEVAVVSPTTGANSHKQIAAQYKFFDMFENIVVCYDNDKAGQEAVEEVIKVLPKGKVKIMNMRMKDANEYLKSGKEAAFISDFFNAKTYTPAGVVGSSALYQRLLDGANVKKVPLPPFMKKLGTMINDIELGTIGVFAAGSGAAKTTVANEMIYFWLFNSPHKVGVVSLELTCEQYAQAMLSRHIRQKISLIRDTDEKIDFLKTEKVRSKAEELFQDSNGGDRFMIIDERDGSIEVLQDKIEELVISCGCRIIVLDPLSDLLDGLSTEAQALFMKWCKSIIKSYNVTFIMISHIRKSGNNKDAASTGAFIPEESIMGSSTIFKSASWVVMMMRDKYNEDPIIRNTTQLVLSKNRAGGDTGPAGELFYDNQQHVLHDKEDWELGNSEF